MPICFPIGAMNSLMADGNGRQEPLLGQYVGSMTDCGTVEVTVASVVIGCSGCTRVVSAVSILNLPTEVQVWELKVAGGERGLTFGKQWPPGKGATTCGRFTHVRGDCIGAMVLEHQAFSLADRHICYKLRIGIGR
eukprot:scaffold30918_cov26-Cyclotella_meneghiniana.AAC.2